jgi:ribosome biogenesis GTPase
MTISLDTLGWNSAFQASFEPFAAQNLIPGRVAAQHKGGYVIFTEQGEFLADAAGKLRHKGSKQDLPVVGDWVAMTPLPNGRGQIRGVLPRQNKFSRKVAGEETHEQIVAANLDTAFIVTSINADYNPRRIERYVVLARETDINPVIVLSKIDLAENVSEIMVELRSLFPDIQVIPLSCKTGAGIDAIKAYLTPGKTASLLGSSGVGKSTLVNYLLGTEKQAVKDIRESDDRGRHATTYRELIVLPQGGLLIDTPGMREVHLWDGARGLQDAFSDFEEVALTCRFSDCEHATEPGCAVKKAIEDGTLDAGRFESYKKLQSESSNMTAKTVARARQDEKKRISKLVKDYNKHHRR